MFQSYISCFDYSSGIENYHHYDDSVSIFRKKIISNMNNISYKKCIYLFKTSNTYNNFNITFTTDVIKRIYEYYYVNRILY